MADQRTMPQAGVGTRSQAIHEGLLAHMNKVYGLMAVAMVVTGLVAYAVGTSPALLGLFRDPITLQPNVLGYVVMFAPLAFVFLFGAMVNRMSEGMAQVAFWFFAALMGLSISWIFVAFTSISIAQTFFATAIGFGAMSLWGYTTKRDLSGMGRFLMMGLIALIVAMILNWFIGSSGLAFAISAIGVLIFAGLTAYDTQRIKNEYLYMVQGGYGEFTGKAAILGALSLYLNFLNMFMFLLQFMGSQE